MIVRHSIRNQIQLSRLLEDTKGLATYFYIMEATILSNATKPTIAFFGATGGCALSTLSLSLKAGYLTTARKPHNILYYAHGALIELTSPHDAEKLVVVSTTPLADS
jgi:hypothetical protein